MLKETQHPHSTRSSHCKQIAGETHLEEDEVSDHQRKERNARDGPHGPVGGNEVHKQGRTEASHQKALPEIHRCQMILPNALALRRWAEAKDTRVRERPRSEGPVVHRATGGREAERGEGEESQYRTPFSLLCTQSWKS